jgi:hypothetical protein
MTLSPMVAVPVILRLCYSLRSKRFRRHVSFRDSLFLPQCGPTQTTPAASPFFARVPEGIVIVPVHGHVVAVVGETVGGVARGDT